MIPVTRPADELHEGRMELQPPNDATKDNNREAYQNRLPKIEIETEMNSHDIHVFSPSCRPKRLRSAKNVKNSCPKDLIS